MNCEEVREKIVLFNELTEEERGEVLEHIKSCKECRLFYEEERKLREILRSVRVESYGKRSWLRVVITAIAVMATLSLAIIKFSSPKNKPYEFIMLQQKNTVVTVFIKGGKK